MGKVRTPYGPKANVEYADPGYRENVARYPIDTPEHVRAAIAYLSKPKNAGFYTPEQLKSMWEKIRAAAKKFGIEVSHDTGQMGIDALPTADSATLLASVAPLAPPAAWFANPGLKAPTKLTITDEGQVFGHLAQWKVCHVGVGNACVMAPKSRLNYDLFRVGNVRTDTGEDVPVGKITLGTAHANPHYGVMPTREHYDNTGLSAAVVNVGEDKHGIWVAGALTTNMTPEKIAEFRAAALSGDWRRVNGYLELIAALAVNNPGFPIYREQDGHAFSLQAVGMVGLTEEFDVSDEDTEVEGTEEESVDEGAEVPADDVQDDAAELAARIERWEMIEQELEEHQQARRAEQLAAIDEDRYSLSENAKSGDMIFLQR